MHKMIHGKLLSCVHVCVCVGVVCCVYVVSRSLLPLSLHVLLLQLLTLALQSLFVFQHVMLATVVYHVDMNIVTGIAAV